MEGSPCSLTRQLELADMAELLYRWKQPAQPAPNHHPSHYYFWGQVERIFSQQIDFWNCEKKKLWIYYHGILISFFSKFGRLCFSLCMVIYLLGDLAIYCAAVAKSLRWWCWCWQCCWWKCWQSSGQENVKNFDFDFDFGLWLYMTYNEFYPKRSAFFPVFFYPFPYILLPFSDLHR